MTNPLSRHLAETLERENAMTEEANDMREGYCDGLAGKRQEGRSIAYRDACDDGAFDLRMMAMVAEWKRRAALLPA